MPVPPPLPRRALPPPLPGAAPDGYRQVAKVCWWRSILFVAGMPVELRSSVVERKPWLTWSLAVLITVSTLLFWFDVDAWMPLVYDPRAAWPKSLAGLFGHELLHADPIHLLGNLYFLLVFGNNVECRFGRRRTLGLFLAAAVCGALLHGACSEMRLVGASGGIFGILVFYVLMFPKARILWLPFGYLVSLAMLAFGRKWLPKGMGVVTWLVIYLLLQVVIAYEQLFLNGNVSAMAHIGGGLAGAAVFLLWKRGWIP
jgi:membrane associated rhomboid family serine protease